MIVPDTMLLWTLWLGSGLLWVGLSVVVIRRWRLAQRRAPWIILGVAVMVRLGWAVWMPPALSDDVWRYLWDGQNLAAGINPYAVSPAEAMDRLLIDGSGPNREQTQRELDLLSRINNPELVTIYQPTSQWFFAGVSWLHDAVTGGFAKRGTADSLGMAFRLTLTLVDAWIILLLLRQLKELGRSAWWAVMYAWSPLAITEVAWSGHQDGLGIMFLILALLLGQRASRARERGGASRGRGWRWRWLRGSNRSSCRWHCPWHGSCGAMPRPACGGGPRVGSPWPRERVC